MILGRAEEAIARLASQAAEARDYPAAEQLLGIARNIAALAGRLTAAKSDGSPETFVSAPEEPGFDGDTDGSDASDDSPVFEREGQNLVKVGGSKTDGKTYEHKAPRATVDVLVRRIGESRNKRGEFRTSRVFPLVDASGRKLPGYQGYLCLRWLRQVGLVQRVGRQRYQVAGDRDLVSSIDAAWGALHER